MLLLLRASSIVILVHSFARRMLEAEVLRLGFPTRCAGLISWDFLIHLGAVACHITHTATIWIVFLSVGRPFWGHWESLTTLSLTVNIWSLPAPHLHNWFVWDRPWLTEMLKVTGSSQTIIMLFLWAWLIRKGVISLLHLSYFFTRIMYSTILMSWWSSFRAHLWIHVMRWIVVVLMIGCSCRHRWSLRHLLVDAVWIVLLLLDRTTCPVRISCGMELAMWEAMMFVRMVIHHVTVRCKEGCSLAIRCCRESERAVRKMICSCHVLLISSFVAFVFESLFRSSFRLCLLQTASVLFHLLFMQLLLFFSSLLNTTLHVSFARRWLWDGHHDIV